MENIHLRNRKKIEGLYLQLPYWFN